MGAGRPPVFDNVEDFEKKANEYFAQFVGFHTPDDEIGELPIKRPENNEHRPTITGLCLFLGFESRQSYHDYSEKSEFSYAFKKARMRIENQYESMLTSGSPTGSIFALKNMGWSDKQEIDHTNKGDKFDNKITQIEIIKTIKNEDSGLDES